MGSEISTLLGRTLKRVEQSDNDRIEFECETGATWEMKHHQDCCESVYIEDVVGDLQDLVGRPILMAEESTSEETGIGTETIDADSMWTFYRFATVRGYVTIRWYGSSNGYYGVGVDFSRISP